mmetsp:Transcript_37850/g.82403  ORF Transcript_37850/g.82403 Transcript_37850/m.82403 type:complete len:260 (+) Transcript_37850:509-1288(+)|eukprot:CAMPEP_0116933210 /NCGR_PEP_ID=MMETSP0467-20121206/28899_1 /TAXON_ID=283647 /ORGANISM="Mesodinium pulex, Strain SPMC105" /LENGTH=259 /DNA_ID=CAMNT_0004614043 /DNA_START=509 /DNA_END=1288 /DNA_ORIENTATION=+
MQSKTLAQTQTQKLKSSKSYTDLNPIGGGGHNTFKNNVSQTPSVNNYNNKVQKVSRELIVDKDQDDNRSLKSFKSLKSLKSIAKSNQNNENEERPKSKQSQASSTTYHYSQRLTDRSKPYGLETNERVQLLMKRSQSSDKVNTIKKVDLKERFKDIEQEISRIKVNKDKEKFSMINEEQKKNQKREEILEKARNSQLQTLENRNKTDKDDEISDDLLRKLKRELEKQQKSKLNALKILKSLKGKDRESAIEEVMQKLSN